MYKKYRRPVSRFSFWSLFFGRFSFFLFLSCTLLHIFAWIKWRSFSGALLCSVFFAAVSVVFFLATLSDLWRSASYGVGRATRGVLYSVLVLGILGFFSIRALMKPPLYDVWSNGIEIPHYLAGLRPGDALPLYAGGSSYEKAQHKYWPELRGRRYKKPLFELLPLIVALLQEKGYTPLKICKAQETSHSIQVETVAKHFFYGGALSDVCVRLYTQGDTTFVDMRATSRYLQRDMGINAALILDFLDRLDSKVLLTADTGG